MNLRWTRLLRPLVLFYFSSQLLTNCSLSHPLRAYYAELALWLWSCERHGAHLGAPLLWQLIKFSYLMSSQNRDIAQEKTLSINIVFVVSLLPSPVFSELCEPCVTRKYPKGEGLFIARPNHCACSCLLLSRSLYLSLSLVVHLFAKWLIKFSRASKGRVLGLNRSQYQRRFKDTSDLYPLRWQ